MFRRTPRPTVMSDAPERARPSEPSSRPSRGSSQGPAVRDIALGDRHLKRHWVLLVPSSITGRRIGPVPEEDP